MPLQNILAQQQDNLKRTKKTPVFQVSPLGVALSSAYTEIGQQAERVSPGAAQKALKSVSEAIAGTVEAKVMDSITPEPVAKIEQEPGAELTTTVITQVQQEAKPARRRASDVYPLPEDAPVDKNQPKRRASEAIVDGKLIPVTKVEPAPEPEPQQQAPEPEPTAPEPEERTEPADQGRLPRDLTMLTNVLHKLGIINKDSLGLFPRLLARQNERARIARGGEPAEEPADKKVRRSRQVSGASEDTRNLREIAANSREILRIIKKDSKPKVGAAAYRPQNIPSGSGGSDMGLGDLMPTGSGRGSGRGSIPKEFEGMSKGQLRLMRVSNLVGRSIIPLAVTGLAAYEGYQGVSSALAEKKQTLSDIDQQEAMGAISSQSAADKRKEASETAVTKTGGAIGSAGGSLAGAYAGGGIGATIGSFILPGVGTAVGGAAGLVVGGIAGSSAGQWIGEKAGGLWNWAFPSDNSVPKVDTNSGNTPLSPDELQSINSANPELAQRYQTDSQSLFKQYSDKWESANPGKQMPPEITVQLAKSAQGQAAGKIRANIKQVNSVQPITAPTAANVLRESGVNKSISENQILGNKASSGDVNVSAPTVNNNVVQQSSVVLQPNNDDPTIQRYIQGAW